MEIYTSWLYTRPQLVGDLMRLKVIRSSNNKDRKKICWEGLQKKNKSISRKLGRKLENASVDDDEKMPGNGWKSARYFSPSIITSF